MPVRKTTTTRGGQKRKGYTAGLGKVFVYQDGNPQSEGAAKARANQQNRARHARERRQAQR